MAPDAQTTTSAATALFPDRLVEAVGRKRSQLLVGLDPRVELLPLELRGDVHLGRAHAAEAVDALLPRPDRRGRAARRRREAADRVLRGARRRRDPGLRGRLRLRAHRGAARASRTSSGATSAPRPARTPPPTSSRAATSRRSPTRSPSARTSAATRSSRSSRPAGCTAPASSSSSRPRTRAAPTSRTSRSRTGSRSGTTSRGSCASGARSSSARTASRASAR